jgi:hypothetical protein
MQIDILSLIKADSKSMFCRSRERKYISENEYADMTPAGTELFNEALNKYNMGDTKGCISKAILFDMVASGPRPSHYNPEDPKDECKNVKIAGVLHGQNIFTSCCIFVTENWVLTDRLELYTMIYSNYIR